LLREGQSEVAKQMEIGDKATTFRIVDPAILPQIPISPNMVRMIMMALAAGLGSGFGLLFLLEQMRNAITDSSQLQALGINVIAIIPTISEVTVDRTQTRQVILVYSLASVYVLGVIGLLVFEAIGRTF
jgi:capsular polysaccharide biosynthesis protein